jgi:dCTP diphosphatase
MADRLDDIIAKLRAFVDERDWGQFHDPKNLAMAVASEAGELAAEYRWIPNDESDAWSTDPANRERVANEAADVAISLLMLFDRVGVNPIAAINAKIGRNRERYPVALSKGRHSKPD